MKKSSIIKISVFLILTQLILLPFLSSCASPETKKKKNIRKQAESHFSEGKKAMKQEDNEEALRQFSEAIALVPDKADYYFERANAYADLYYQTEKKNKNDKQLDKIGKLCIDDLSKTIQLNPKHYKAYTNRGSSYATIKQYDKALNDYNNAIKINPQYAEAYFWRAWVYKKQKKYDLVKPDLEKVVKYAPFSYGIGAREELKKLKKEGLIR